MNKDYLTVDACSKRTPFAPLQCRTLEPNTIHSVRPPKAYYLSPLEAESIRHRRAKEFGLSSPATDSFLHNQSFPGPHKSPENGNLCTEMNNIHRCSIDKFRGDELNTISFSPIKNSYFEDETCKNHNLDGSWMLYKYIENNSRNPSLHSFAHNPNKAIVTVNTHTSEILTANKAAVRLLGFKEKDRNIKLNDLIIPPDDQYLLAEADLKPDGEIILFSGKIMTLVNRNNESIAISMWAKRFPIESDLRCLVIMEQVDRAVGTFKFDAPGTILECDISFANIYGCETTEEIIKRNIKDFIPTFELDFENHQGDLIPEDGLQMCATGKTKDNCSFPLNIHIQYSPPLNPNVSKTGDDLKSESLIYEGTVWVFSNVSGLITILPSGTIHSCNTNFSMMFFGYSQNELIGKDIAMLIPSFYDDVEFLDTNSVALPPFDDDDDDSINKLGNSDGRTTADSFVADPPRPMNPLGKPLNYEAENYDYEAENHDLSYSPSSQTNFSLADRFSVEDPQLKDNSKLSSSHLETNVNDGCDKLKFEEQSTSSVGNSSRQMSCSESQDTLHSGTNSIAESDVNANVLESIENRDCPDSSVEQKNVSCVKENECDSFESETNSSSSEHSENEEIFESEEEFSDNEQINSDEEKKVLSPFVCDCKCDNVSPSDRHLSECFLNLPASHVKMSTPVHSYHISKSSHDISNQSIPEGVYIGTGKHKDGTGLAIEYCIKKVLLDNGKFIYCLWVSRDPQEIKECSPVSKSTTSSHIKTAKTSKSGSEETQHSSLSSSSSFDENYLEGPFTENYTVIKHLGKGAFGCVKKAYRKIDGLLVIAKFIKKSEVYNDSWVFDNKFKKKVPLEISLLTTIDHPNIVKVIDVFENEHCFNMVMEKHGCGIDLFEFIERNPKMDEALASYIFRQIVFALSYLHSLNIMHRDIKDENAIINEKFQVKLIDFGSAAFMKGELFTVFCGTTEYCAPEVLKGEKYRGPELEMFALGVTLFTLVIGDNPFNDADEILKGDYKIEKEISESLTGLIQDLLEPNALDRCTLQEVENHPWVNQPVLIQNYKFSDVVNASESELHPAKYKSLSGSENDDSYDTASFDFTCLEKKIANIELNAQSNSLSESESSS